jgi:hypothetical protein
MFLQDESKKFLDYTIAWRYPFYMATETAIEYAKRQEKAARFSAYFFAAGLHSSQVSLMAVDNPFWGKLAASISRESGRKLLPPHSQETVDAIVRELGYFEDAKAARERATDVPFEVRW